MKRAGSLCALMALPALAQVSSAPDRKEIAEATRQFQMHHGPARNVVVRPDGSLETENWSGYGVTGKHFKEATGSSIEPSTSCSSGEWAAFWVGIDGLARGSDTVEQTGTLVECNGTTPFHVAWYEFCCREPIDSITVSPGDKFSASVTYSGSTFTLKITNETTGESFTKSGKNAGAERSSAEWITEAPDIDGSIAPLADFGTVSFGLDYTGISSTNDATDSSHNGVFNSFPDVDAITMVSSGGATERCLQRPLRMARASRSPGNRSRQLTWAGHRVNG